LITNESDKNYGYYSGGVPADFQHFVLKFSTFSKLKYRFKLWVLG